MLSAQASKMLNEALLSERMRHDFESGQDYDFALALDETHRYRVNLMVHKEGVAGTYRIVPN